MTDSEASVIRHILEDLEEVQEYMDSLYSDEGMDNRYIAKKLQLSRQRLRRLSDPPERKPA